MGETGFSVNIFRQTISNLIKIMDKGKPISNDDYILFVYAHSDAIANLTFVAKEDPHPLLARRESTVLDRASGQRRTTLVAVGHRCKK